MAYRDYVGEIKGTIPRIPYPLAQKYVNRAWAKIRDLRLWSFLISTADILSAQNITTGTVTVAQGSATVTLDTAAATALSAIALSNPPLASPTLGQGRQIRVGTSGTGLPVYSIIAAEFVGNTLTLDRPYTGASGSAQAYQVYKCYYAPPDTDFLRYLTITNMRAGYTIRGKKLYYTQQKLNAVDAQRGGNGDAYIISSYRTDSSNRPVHEWYPHPVNAATYNCVYQKRGTDLSNTIDLPATFPSSCLISLALVLSANWALANVATYPELAGTNWVMFRQQALQDFKDEIIQAIKQDDEIFPITPFLQGSYFDFPLGGQFMQGHDVSSLIGDLA